MNGAFCAKKAPVIVIGAVHFFLRRCHFLVLLLVVLISKRSSSKNVCLTKPHLSAMPKTGGNYYFLLLEFQQDPWLRHALCPLKKKQKKSSTSISAWQLIASNLISQGTLKVASLWGTVGNLKDSGSTLWGTLLFLLLPPLGKSTHIGRDSLRNT